MGNWLFYLLCSFAGILFAVQTGTHNYFARSVNNPFFVAMISFTIGAICLTALYWSFLKTPISWQQIKIQPWWAFLGGIYGITIVSIMALSPAKIGVAAALALLVSSQMITAAIIDHYGFLKTPITPLNIARIFGILFLTLGVYLVTRK